MQVRTNVKAGGFTLNHNQTKAQPARRSLTVKTDVKAGLRYIKRSKTTEAT